MFALSNDVNERCNKYNENIKLSYLYLQERYKDMKDDTLSTLLEDYIEMIMQCNEKIKLNISFNRLKAEHNRLSRQILLKIYNDTPLKIHPKFQPLNLSNEFTILKSHIEVALEGEKQKHCVASYIPRINKGNCIIATTIYRNKRYTLEIIKAKNGFKLHQIQGFANQPAPNRLIGIINKELGKFSKKEKQMVKIS